MGRYLVPILSEHSDYNITVTSRQSRTSQYENVEYVCGNAREAVFLDKLLSQSWDVIVDFMNWGYDEFAASHKKLLEAADQYVFLSSSRVYDNLCSPITEAAPRLLDTTTDSEFLSTQRYALRKARQENMLLSSGRNNFTIIRPYKSYSSERLQLGVYEKEQWLYRILNNKPVVIKKDVLDKKTCMTFSADVADAIAGITANSKALGQTYQIASSETLTWREILCIYISVIQKKTSAQPTIVTYDDEPEIDECFEGGYQMKYDVLWDRCFNSARIEKTLGRKINYTPMREGLSACLEEFLECPSFLAINEEFEALADSVVEKQA